MGQPMKHKCETENTVLLLKEQRMYLRLMEAQKSRLAYLSGLSTKSSGASLTGMASKGTLSSRESQLKHMSSSTKLLR